MEEQFFFFFFKYFKPVLGDFVFSKTCSWGFRYFFSSSFLFVLFFLPESFILECFLKFVIFLVVEESILHGLALLFA